MGFQKLDLLASKIKLITKQESQYYSESKDEWLIYSPDEYNPESSIRNFWDDIGKWWAFVDPR